MTFDEFIEDEKVRDPEFRREWEASGPAFEIMQAVIGARSRHNWTQEELARRMETTQAQVSRAENTGHVSPEYLTRFAAAVGGEIHLSLKLPGAARLTVKLDVEPSRSSSLQRPRHRLVFTGVAARPRSGSLAQSRPCTAVVKLKRPVTIVGGHSTSSATLAEV